MDQSLSPLGSARTPWKRSGWHSGAGRIGRLVLERLLFTRKDSSRSLRQRLTDRQMQPVRKQRVLLLGLFGCGNYGNDGSLEAMIGFLRHHCPAAELTAVCVNPAQVEADHQISGIQINWPGFNNPVLEFLDRKTRKLPRRLSNLVRTIQEVRRFDAVIVPGTGILTDYKADPFGAPYWVFRWCVAARLCGVRLSLVNIGAGPIERPLSRWMLKQAARAASYRSFRDTFSRDFVAGMGVDTSADQVYPDIAFMLGASEPVQPPRSVADLATVGVGVMSYYGWQGQAQAEGQIHQSYLAQLGEFVAWLLQRGHPVRLLVGEITDEAVADGLRAYLRRKHGLEPGDEVLLFQPIRSLHDLMRQIATTDVVVASRYHNIVCALKLGRPTISISYTKKHDELMNQVGLDRFCQPIEQLNAARLVQQFQELLADRTMHEAHIAACVAAFRDHMKQQDRILLQSIRHQAPDVATPIGR